MLNTRTMQSSVLRMRWARGAAALLAATLACTATGEAFEVDVAAPLGEPGSVVAGPSRSFYFENDGTFVRPNDNTDRHYTSGQGFSVAWRGAGRGIADRLGLPASDRTAMGVLFAQQLFTPDNIAQPREADDRPFAGYLYVGGFWQRQRNDVFDHVQVDVGVVGPSSLGEQVQELVHEFTDADDPDWDGQLGDEFQFNLTLRRKWRFDLGQTSLAGRQIDWQLIPRAELDVGTTYRRAAVGGLVRVGYRMPDDFGPGRLLDLASETSDFLADRDTGLSTYVFGQAVGRYVEWNTFLDGSNSRDPSLSVSREPFVSELSAGFAVEWKRHGVHTRVAYLQTVSSREFETQDGGNTVGSIAARVILSY